MSWLAPPGAVPVRKNLAIRLNASGNGTDRIVNNNSARLWVVVQLSIITSPTSSGCTCVVTPPTGIMDTSYFAGTGDVAGGEPEFLYEGDYLELAFANGPANGTGIATYTYYELALS